MRLKLGTLDFEVPPMPAAVLRSHNRHLEVLLNLVNADKGRLLPTEEEVTAIIELTQALAERAGVSLSSDEIAERLPTTELPTAMRALISSYMGPTRSGEEAPAGEPVSPSSSTQTPSSGT